MSVIASYDILLRGGRVIDPAAGIDGLKDVAIRNGMVGVQSGVTTLIDQGGPSCMTLPGFRHFIAEPAKSRVYAFLSAYLVGGLEGHFYPNLYSPDGVDIEATIAAAKANRDLVRGIKGHAEIGGFA